MSTVIEVTKLNVRYGDFHAVKDLSFQVRRGEFYALLGTNGAGKTSALEVVEGHRPAESGTVRVLGQSPRDALPCARGWASCCRRAASLRSPGSSGDEDRNRRCRGSQAQSASGPCPAAVSEAGTAGGASAVIIDTSCLPLGSPGMSTVDRLRVAVNGPEQRLTRTDEDRCPLLRQQCAACPMASGTTSEYGPIRGGSVRCLCGGPVGWIRPNGTATVVVGVQGCASAR
ncbi:ATP-binding cassette domain-containing protein [Streptomyces sp. NPDC021218]|uniref:ATP-binding cassette domain-containing protein n=2 Tax=Streptomyces TaxID=1883 RepID=UPI0036B8C0A4